MAHSPSGFEFSNFESTMRMLQKMPISSEMEPIKSLSVSTMQMFTATFLANIQTMSKQQETIESLRRRVEHLEETERHSDSLAPLVTRIQRIEQKLNIVDESESQGFAGEVSSPTGGLNDKLRLCNSRIDTVEQQIIVVSNKLTEMAKRYKKQQSLFSQFIDHAAEMEKSIKQVSSSSGSAEIEAVREEFKTTLIQHETELEGIINTILEDMGSMREDVSTQGNQLKAIPSQVSTIVSSATEKQVMPLSDRIVNLHGSMKKVVANVNHMKLFCKKMGMPSMPKKRANSENEASAQLSNTVPGANRARRQLSADSKTTSSVRPPVNKRIRSRSTGFDVTSDPAFKSKSLCIRTGESANSGPVKGRRLF